MAKNILEDKLAWCQEHNARWRGEVEIGPVLAQWLLDRNTVNRPISFRNKAKLTREMLEEYVLLGDMITLCMDGILGDGQHRLEVIRDQGITRSFNVFVGADPRSRLKAGGGLPRNIRVQLNYSGLLDDGITASALATLRHTLCGLSGPRDFTTNDLLAALKKYRPAIDFAEARLPYRRSNGLCAATKGAIARAYYHESRARLEEFCERLTDGPENKLEKSNVGILRDFLGRSKNNGGGIRCKAAVDRYGKTTRALLAFLDEVALPAKRLYGLSTDYYELPVDPVAWEKELAAKARKAG